MKRDVKAIIREMTLEEKAGMCSGKDFWHLKGVERLGIPEVMLHKEFPLFRTAHRYSSCQGYSFRGLSAVQQSLIASFLSIFLPRRGTDLL